MFVQVMGRHCGYLALVAALAAEADFCFIPEWAPPVNWPEILCKKLSQVGMVTTEDTRYFFR